MILPWFEARKFLNIKIKMLFRSFFPTFQFQIRINKVTVLQQKVGTIFRIFLEVCKFLCSTQSF